MTDLTTLIERVRGLTGADRTVDWEIHVMNGIDGAGSYGNHPVYTRSVDAALAFVKADELDAASATLKQLADALRAGEVRR